MGTNIEPSRRPTTKRGRRITDGKLTGQKAALKMKKVWAKPFSMATNVDVYFCDPQSPWQRGSNENTNRLLRHYFPRQTTLAPYSQAALNKVARQLNERPRKTLDFQTPAERFDARVALTS